MTTSPSTTGVLVLTADASVQEVDSAALSLLGATRASLLNGSAPILNSPVSTDDGTTYCSVKTLLDNLFAEESSSETATLSNGRRAEVRVTYNSKGPSGAVLLLQNQTPVTKPSPNPRSSLSREKYVPFFEGSVDRREHHRAEANLRADRDLLRRTQELARVGGWEYDPYTDVMIGTEETYRLYELPPDAEFTLEQSLTFYPPKTRAALQNAATRCLERGESFDLEGPMTAQKGTERWVRIQGEPRRNDHGAIAKMVGTVQDVTQRHEMEERLREQKEWLQSITENISGGVSRSTDEGIVYANQALLDLFGYESLDALSAASPTSLFVNSEEWNSLTEREIEERGLDGVEVEYRRKDGSTFTGLLRSTLITGDDGTPKYYDRILTDITEQKQREEKMREQRRKIEALFEPSGNLLRADNREAVASVLVDLVFDTFGYPGVVIRCVQGDQLVPLNWNAPSAIEPHTFSKTGESIVSRIFRTGDTHVIDDVRSLDDSIDYGQARTIAGIPLSEHGILTLASFESNGIDPFDLQLIDILTQKATAVLGRLDQNAHLQASEERFRGLFEEAALGIALIESDGTIVEANPELVSMLGYEREVLHGRRFSTFSHPEDLDRDEGLFNELILGTRDRYEIEKRYVRQDDSVFWGRLTVSLHRGPGDAQVIGMLEDINSRKRYEQQLREAKQEAEEASRLKSALLANMSHEIRTPLTSIIGFAGVLKDNLSGPNQRYADLAHQGGKRLMETLDSVIQLSKLEAGVVDPDARRMDLTELTHRTVNLYRSEAESAQINLQVEASTAPLYGHWAPNAVQRILSNLLSNAIKFSPDGGVVTVRIRSSSNNVLLDVSDSGVGIDDSFRPRLFDAFTQESEGLKREHEGSGLGLAIVKRLVDLLGGQIDVESSKGVGTRFTVQLPRNQ